MQCVPFDPDRIYYLFVCKDTHTAYEFALLLDTATTSVTMMRETLKTYPDLAHSIQLACSFPTSRDTLKAALDKVSGRWCLWANDGRSVARVMGQSMVHFSTKEDE